MKKFETVTSRAVIIDRSNVDTDVILPAKYLKTVTRAGLGKAAFEAIRAEADNPFVAMHGEAASILVAGSNFGCGSSREHAVWAIVDLGIKVVIAPSFSDIFAGNAAKNGLLTISLAEDDFDLLMQLAPNCNLTVDLENCTIAASSTATVIPFQIDPALRQNLLSGVDEISQSLSFEDAIAAYERDNVITTETV